MLGNGAQRESQKPDQAVQRTTENLGVGGVCQRGGNESHKRVQHLKLLFVGAVEFGVLQRRVQELEEISWINKQGMTTSVIELYMGGEGSHLPPKINM